MTQPGSDIRETSVQARSTDTFGRVMVSARHHHLVIDGPAQNGCPGEAITPPEAFLGAIAACAVELIEVIAREQEVALAGVAAGIHGVIDRANPPRRDVSVFSSVRLDVELHGVGDAQGAALVEAFKAR